MTGALGSAELELFQIAIGERLGLCFDDNRLTFLAEVLARRIQARRLSAGAYLAALGARLEASDELSALARELTVGETYFFRQLDQFHALRDVAVPERLSARGGGGTLRLVSAGCSTGEEAYSLSIVLREHGLPAGVEPSVVGLDLNPDALAKAARAIYSPWSLRETPADVRERWFTREGREFRLAGPARDGVRFAEHNLVTEAPRLLPPRSVDVIFCRNVLMYFTPAQAAAVVERFSRALAPGGFLFLGHAETLRGLSHDFHLRHTHNTFYYQRRDGAERTAHSSTPPAPRPHRPDAAPRDAWIAPWLDTVARSSERIRELKERSATPEVPTPLPPSESYPPPPDDARLSRSMELLRNDRFAEALTAMHQLSPHEKADPAALLLRAALLTHQGELSDAEDTCRELLRRDDLNAGAHYLLALCSERRGQLPAAVEHDQTAAYLDGEFAMPHLHLGLMARRRLDADTAKRELTLALSLLEREDGSRLLLFGGGFSRSALLALCRSELRNLRGGA